MLSKDLLNEQQLLSIMASNIAAGIISNMGQPHGLYEETYNDWPQDVAKDALKVAQAITERNTTHRQVHHTIDWLFAQYIEAHPHRSGFLETPIKELIEWSYQRVLEEEIVITNGKEERDE